MQLSDFDYSLPERLIAQHPLAERSASRLMTIDPLAETIEDEHFTDLIEHIDLGDLLIFNNTRVIPARLMGRKETGGKIEVMIERVLNDSTLLAHIRASKSPRPGTRLILEESIHCSMNARQGDLFELVQNDQPWLELLERFGRMPLPPYIKRQDIDTDRERYQTVYASEPGAVAAPTAGLHFEQDTIARLKAKGVRVEQVTLHVGAGTFQPVRDEIESHLMHAELVEVSPAVCEAIGDTKARGGRVIAVGTTVVRSLESAFQQGKLGAFNGESRLFIKPGFEFKVVDAMLTNFHLPRSTLLMLVSAFAGTDLIQRAYAQAVEREYRFFSYGDAMFLTHKIGADV